MSCLLSRKIIFNLIYLPKIIHMTNENSEAKKAFDHISSTHNLENIIDSIKKKVPISESASAIPVEGKPTVEGTKKRIHFLAERQKRFEFLTGEKAFSDIESLEGNIENYVGMTMVPTGVIGPLHVIGTDARGDYYVPLATSEGALVASYNRGARATRMAGGITSICYLEALQRSPVFKFNDMGDLGKFLVWVIPQMPKFQEITVGNSRFAKLIDLGANIEGNHLILTMEFKTGDAAGQNMVTLCTEAIYQYIIENAPIQPNFWFIEGNYSGDKKATARSFTHVRGKKVSAEVTLEREIVEKILRTTPEMMAEYWHTSTVGVIQSGAFGAQGHVANGLCALFMATGQDVACVAEAAVGITRMELTESGGLYASVTLPNLVVGTVGGGTGLPTQCECLALMECYGAGNARKFAEICGALVLSGELSIAAALSAGHFASAHKKFGRKSMK